MRTGFKDEKELDSVLSEPTPKLVEFMKGLDGDIIVLGCGGKVGISLSCQAKRAINEAGIEKRVIGVDLMFSDSAKSQFEEVGVEMIQCNLLDRAQVAQLPKIKNVIFMAGRKFGTQGQEHLTWAMNTMVPANVGEQFSDSKIVAFSTGCVYPLMDPESDGPTEDVKPEPIGEYAQSCLGRERVFEYYSAEKGTKVCLFRLNYSIEMRYGILHDIATKIKNGEPVENNIGVFNIIWQNHATERALYCLDYCESPARPMNVTGPEKVKVVDVAKKLGELMGKEVTFNGDGTSPAYLNNAAQSIKLFGPTTVTVDEMVQWTADWFNHGGSSLGKPTHFEVNNGKF